MARSDLLISLVKAGSSGDTARARSVTEAIIAEERAKRHNVLAERLSDAMRVNGATGTATFIDPGRQQRQFLLELTPRKRLDDLVLTDLARRTCEELIEEQHRASVLRAHSLEPRHRVLLVGPPGNGKTSLAEAIAEVLAAPFFVVRYETLIGRFLGWRSSRYCRFRFPYLIDARADRDGAAAHGFPPGHVKARGCSRPLSVCGTCSTRTAIR